MMRGVSWGKCLATWLPSPLKVRQDIHYLITRARATMIAVQKLTDSRAVNIQVRRKVMGNPQSSMSINILDCSGSRQACLGTSAAAPGSDE